MKQYMVMKMVGELGKAMNITPILGLATREAAAQAVIELKGEDPEAVYLIQEVGMA